MCGQHYCIVKEMLAITADVAGDLMLRDDDCFALCIMSHGQRRTLHTSDTDTVVCECVLGVDSLPVNTASLLAPFSNERCPPLRGKPKIVIFQACRGGVYCVTVCRSFLAFELFISALCKHVHLSCGNC